MTQEQSVPTPRDDAWDKAFSLMVIILAIVVVVLAMRGRPDEVGATICGIELAPPSTAADSLRVMRLNATCQDIVTAQFERDRQATARRRNLGTPNVPDTLERAR